MSPGKKKFELTFHSIILFLAIGIVTAYIFIDVQWFYIILGVLIAANSIYRIIRALNKKPSQSPPSSTGRKTHDEKKPD